MVSGKRTAVGDSPPDDSTMDFWQGANSVVVGVIWSNAAAAADTACGLLADG